MRAPFLLAATLTLATLAAAAMLPASAQQAPTPQLVLEISDETSRPSKSFEAFDTVQFTVFDFNDDGIQEIVAKNDNNWVYVLDARTGRILAEMEDGVYPDWGYRELAGVAIGDVNGNGRWDLVSPSSAGIVTVWELDPSKSDGTRLHFDELWHQRVDPEMADPRFREENPWSEGQSTGFDGAPYLADADGDGDDEIFLQADNLAGHWAFDGDGELLWGKTFDDGNANPWVADLDENGKLEVVFGTDAGRVWVYDAQSGDLRWKFQAREHGAEPGSISVAPGLIDLTGDGKLEVVFGTRVAVEDPDDPEWYMRMHTMLFALDHRGDLLWNKSFEWGEPHVYMFPAAYDVNGDGKDDAVFIDWNTIGHKPGNWETTGAPNLFALDEHGNALFHTKVSTYWSNKNVVVADVDADGVQELVVNKGGDEDGIAFYDPSGKEEGVFPLPWSASRAPLVTDLYGDGRMHMLVPMSKTRDEPNYREVDVGYRHGRIAVYDMGVPHDAAWDNVFVFNQRLDHLYGGADEGTGRETFEVHVAPVESESGLAVRVETDASVASVTAHPDAGGEPVDLTRDASGVWRAEAEGGAFVVTVRLDDGAYTWARVQALRPGGAPVQGETPEPGSDVGADAPAPTQRFVPGAPAALAELACASVALRARRRA